MRIGTMFLGEVDQLENESIQTKFLVVGVPLVPTSSWYVLGSNGSSIRGFEIAIHGKSVAFGYLRVGLWIAALLCGVFAYVESRHDATSLTVTSGILLLAAIAMTFFAGKLSSRELQRRGWLKAVTGVGAPPSLLKSLDRDPIAERLLTRWNKERAGENWERAAETGVADPLLFAIAEYHLRNDLADRVLNRLGSREGYKLS
jgi:hypothetical protein